VSDFRPGRGTLRARGGFQGVWLAFDFVYDPEHDLYRFPDGEFAFSKEYANERRLREMGIIG
jgi:hypothetical protein